MDYKNVSRPSALKSVETPLDGTEGAAISAIGLDRSEDPDFPVQLDIVYRNEQTLVIPVHADGRAEIGYILKDTVEAFDCRSWFMSTYAPEPTPETVPEGGDVPSESS